MKINDLVDNAACMLGNHKLEFQCVLWSVQLTEGRCEFSTSIIAGDSYEFMVTELRDSDPTSRTSTEIMFILLQSELG